ncbi:MAG TPA: gephyrin-like molybdotransferase Glp [Allosphingosinicella sp.]|uniref:molybdopterin molybdotransferase MoeA n=1 Tax=Allosphingosinicella sp. TaxID=2823234 RepID=UPI002ED91AA4
MLSLQEARAKLLHGLAAMPAETISIEQCGGRILAEDVIAARSQPPSPLSAMDGYAARAEDAAAGAVLRLVGEAPAGAPFDRAIEAGETVRIATGGIVPENADCIVIQENVRRSEEQIRVEVAPTRGEFVRPAGCDFVAGTVLARSGEVLTPARQALVAAANAGKVAVHRKPKVVVVPSGDELREPGGPLEPWQIANSATYAILDLARRWGADAHRSDILPDDKVAARAALKNWLEADVVVTIGGASVGDRDVLRPLIVELGAELLFDRIALQPGKPAWHARFPDGRLVLGLPGNPVSAYVCAHLLLKPLLHALLGRNVDAKLETVRARLGARLPKSGPRETFVRAELAVDAEGSLIAAPEPRLDSSLLVPLAAANALVHRNPYSAKAESGELVDILVLIETF